MHSNLLTQRHQAEADNATVLAEREQSVQQVFATMRLALQHSQARGSEKAHLDRIRRSQPLDDIQPVGQHGRGLLNFVVFEQRSGQTGGQRNRHRATSTDVLLGTQQAISQRAYGSQDAPFAQVAHAHHPFTEPANGIEPWGPIVVWRPLDDAPGFLRMPLEQHQPGDLIGDDGLQFDRHGPRCLNPRPYDGQYLIGAVGKVRRSARYRCSFAMRFRIGGRILLEMCDQLRRFDMSVAHSQ
ncbi:hypothetical protein D3C76_552200 [compost metagenome]